MSVKIIMMAFRRLEEADIRTGVTTALLLDADPTGRLQHLPDDQLQKMIPIAALKSSWGIGRLTKKYNKY